VERAQGAYGQKKKELAEALDGLRETGRATNEYLQKVSLARRINKVCGYGAVSPWDVGELTEDWAEMFCALYEYESKDAEEKRQEAESSRQFEDVLSKRRREHPSYRKY